MRTIWAVGPTSRSKAGDNHPTLIDRAPQSYLPCKHQRLTANPLETGEQTSIDQSLADKLAMSPRPIAKACKIGECVPK